MPRILLSASLVSNYCAIRTPCPIKFGLQDTLSFKYKVMKSFPKSRPGLGVGVEPTVAAGFVFLLLLFFYVPFPPPPHNKCVWKLCIQKSVSHIMCMCGLDRCKSNTWLLKLWLKVKLSAWWGCLVEPYPALCRAVLWRLLGCHRRTPAFPGSPACTPTTEIQPFLLHDQPLRYSPFYHMSNILSELWRKSREQMFNAYLDLVAWNGIWFSPPPPPQFW